RESSTDYLLDVLGLPCSDFPTGRSSGSTGSSGPGAPAREAAFRGSSLCLGFGCFVAPCDVRVVRSVCFVAMGAPDAGDADHRAGRVSHGAASDVPRDLGVARDGPDHVAAFGIKI